MLYLPKYAHKWEIFLKEIQFLVSRTPEDFHLVDPNTVPCLNTEYCKIFDDHRTD